MTAIMPIDEPSARAAVLGERADRRACVGLIIFSIARFAAALSRRAIWRGLRITKARCRTWRKLVRSSAA